MFVKTYPPITMSYADWLVACNSTQSHCIANELQADNQTFVLLFDLIGQETRLVSKSELPDTAEHPE